MNKRRKRNAVGIILLVAPFSLIFLAPVLYAIFDSVATAAGWQGGGLVVINTVLGLMGLVGLLAIIPCAVVGIIFLTTKKK